MEIENTFEIKESTQLSFFNKSSVTNLIALLIVVLGYYSPYYKGVLLNIGLFALSGAITNWLAIHMLFEKVPFLYGSGVIPNRFEDFKSGIRNLIMNEFFNKSSVENFFRNHQQDQKFDLTPMIKSLDYQKIFDGLVQVILESSFGGMLNMFGGEKVLDQLRSPFEKKLSSIVENMVAEDSFQKKIMNSYGHQKSRIDQILIQIENIVSSRLEELTPSMVKEIIQRMIKEHLGWLVVWGGVFGGLIGLIAAFI